MDLTDEQIIAIRKNVSTMCLDYSKPYVDAIAFARAVIAECRGGVQHNFTSNMGSEFCKVCGASIFVHTDDIAPPLTNCRDALPGRARCDMCAAGKYEQCRYMVGKEQK